MTLPKPTPKFYWDACSWIGLINQESAKHRELRLVWERAKRGECDLYTSAYTYLEVVKAKSPASDPLSQDESDKRIDDVLDQPFVQIVQLDTIVARLARRLRRIYPVELKQKGDAIHVASAAQVNVDALHTYDGSGPTGRSKLLDLDGKVPRADGEKLRICMPDSDTDGPLFGGTKDLKDD